MQVVTDGDSYYVLHRVMDEDCRVRLLPSGETRVQAAGAFAPGDPDAALRTVENDLTAARVGSNSAVALFIELAVAGPASARELLDRLDVCESDLHGAVSELRAAGVVESTTVYGERGYRVATETT